MKRVISVKRFVEMRRRYVGYTFTLSVRKVARLALGAFSKLLGQGKVAWSDWNAADESGDTCCWVKGLLGMGIIAPENPTKFDMWLEKMGEFGEKPKCKHVQNCTPNAKLAEKSGLRLCKESPFEEVMWAPRESEKSKRKRLKYNQPRKRNGLCRSKWASEEDKMSFPVPPEIPPPPREINKRLSWDSNKAADMGLDDVIPGDWGDIDGWTSDPAEMPNPLPDPKTYCEKCCMPVVELQKALVGSGTGR